MQVLIDEKRIIIAINTITTSLTTLLYDKDFVKNLI